MYLYISIIVGLIVGFGLSIIPEGVGSTVLLGAILGTNVAIFLKMENKRADK